MTITYNHLNLPRLFTWTSGSFNGNSVEILYDAAGTKLKKTVKTGATVNYTQEYIGGIEYRDGVREAIYHAEGRVKYTSPSTTRYEYTIKDHLGNARISFSDLNANGAVDFSTEVLQENHYYPFGLNMDGKWMNDAALDNKYQYNGKEINDDFGLNWYNYGKRWYDAAIGRFPTVDPIASDFAFVTPYNYAENEPVANLDLWGLQKYSFKELVRMAQTAIGWDDQTRQYGPENQDRASEVSKGRDVLNTVAAVPGQVGDAMMETGGCINDCGDYVVMGGAAIATVAPPVGAETIAIGDGISKAGLIIQMAGDKIKNGEIKEIKGAIALEVTGMALAKTLSKGVDKVLGKEDGLQKSIINSKIEGVIEVAKKGADKPNSETPMVKLSETGRDNTSNVVNLPVELRGNR